MSLLAPDCLRQANIEVLDRWQRPNPDFASGADFRTTENALLILFYRQLLKASEYGWLNAGRRLIDKTYLQILWHVEGLHPMRTVPPQDIAAQLDSFIYTQLKPRWPLVAGATLAETLPLVRSAATSLFGCFHSEVAASRLLFYLCPMLPVYSYSRGHRQALQALGYTLEPGYAAYAKACRDAQLQDSFQLEELARPQEFNGNHHDQRALTWLIGHTDWWPRRVWLQGLKNYGADSLGIDKTLFGCNDEGC